MRRKNINACPETFATSLLWTSANGAVVAAFQYTLGLFAALIRFAAAVKTV